MKESKPQINYIKFPYKAAVVWEKLSNIQAGQLLKALFQIYDIKDVAEPLVQYAYKITIKNVKYFPDRLPIEEWYRIRKSVFEFDAFTCQYCGAENTILECDHMIPISRGGKNITDNLITACLPCNRSKRDKTVSEWLGT